MIVSALSSIPDGYWSTIAQSPKVPALAYAICALHGLLSCRQLYGCRGSSQHYTFTTTTLIAAINALIGLELSQKPSTPEEISASICKVSDS